MNGPYPEITNISSLAKLFFKSFISLKHLSDYRTVGLSDCRIIATAPQKTTHTNPGVNPGAREGFTAENYSTYQ